MSLELHFEGDVRVTEPNFIAACVMSGAEIDERRPGVVDLVFPASGLWVFGTALLDDTTLRAECRMGATFKVAYRAVLRPNNPEYPRCMDDLAHLLDDLYRRSQAHFLVTVEHESLAFASLGQGVQRWA